MKKRLLILSGPTHEYFDPVRFIGNASSGRMGKALAEEAIQQGYTIDFITGPVAKNYLPDLQDAGTIHKIISAEDMLTKALELFPNADITIFAAAVADYAPAQQHQEKMAKKADGLTLELQATPDISKTLGTKKSANQINIGFALQTSDGEKNASKKLASKNFDGIILNTPATLGSSTGTFSFLAKSSTAFNDWGCIDKKECAKRILREIQTIRER